MNCGIISSNWNNRIELSTLCVTFINCIFSFITNINSNGGAIYYYSTSSNIIIQSTSFYNIKTINSNNGGGLWSLTKTNISKSCFNTCESFQGPTVYIIGNAYCNFTSSIYCYSRDQDVWRINSGYHLHKNLNSSNNKSNWDGAGFETYLTQGVDISFITLFSNIGAGVLTLYTVTFGLSFISKIQLINSTASTGVIYISSSWTLNESIFLNNSIPFITINSGSLLIQNSIFDKSISLISGLTITNCETILNFNPSKFIHLNTFLCQGHFLEFTIQQNLLNINSFLFLISLII